MYNSVDSSVLTAVFGILGFLLLICFAISAFSIIVMWKIFKKAGKPGWASLIPFYSTYVFFEISWGNGLYFFLTFLGIIPFVGSFALLAVMIITYIKLARAFNENDAFAVGLTFLNLIFMAILAFGKSEYVGVESLDSNNVNKNLDSQLNNLKFCSSCGTGVNQGASFCINCGNKLNP